MNDDDENQRKDNEGQPGRRTQGIRPRSNQANMQMGHSSIIMICGNTNERILVLLQINSIIESEIMAHQN